MLKTNKYARDNRKLTIIILKNMLKMEMKMQKNMLKTTKIMTTMMLKRNNNLLKNNGKNK